MYLLSKLYTWSPQQAIDDIIAHRHKHNHCVVHFLYFANVVKQRLFDMNVIPTPFDKLRVNSVEGSNTVDQDLSTSLRSAQDDVGGYYYTLKQASFLLPDGIALQTFYAAAVSLGRVSSPRRRLANCNGTDLTLPLLQALPKDTQIHLYGAKSAVIKKAADFLRTQGITPASMSDGYHDFDRSIMDTTQKNILLIGRGTPLQELRVSQHIQQIKKYNVLVVSVGWLFDFWWGEEKRTPKIFRGRAERLRRLCVNPRKNAIKVRYSLSLPYMIIRHLLLKRKET